MIEGLRTVIYQVDDLARAKQWYASVLGFGPYFDEPFYVGFNVGGYELGLDPDGASVVKGNNAVAYWGVGDIKTAYEGLLAKGATAVSGPRNVGGEIYVALVKDPFGNTFGIIENPHFKIED